MTETAPARMWIIIERWAAGLPFLYHATRAEEVMALRHPDRLCMGEPVTIIDREGDYYVLQRTAPGPVLYPDGTDPLDGSQP